MLTSSSLVFVHGLHGASERLSWVSSALPDARVISYSYQDIQSSQAIQDLEFLHTLANKLVACLKKLRDGLATRPFMFLGHSVGASVITEVSNPSSLVVRIDYTNKLTLEQGGHQAAS
jgi:pimeloyl-ACP methyl ester carboxylesterase